MKESDDEASLKLTKDNRRALSRESGVIEFKESFVWGEKEKYAKTMAAFANNRGGKIYFGIKNNPHDLVGLLDDAFSRMDVATIGRYINSVFAPAIVFQKEVITRSPFRIGVIHVYPSREKPVVAIRTQGSIIDGEIYYRYPGETNKIKSAELKTLIEYEKDKVDGAWRELIKNMGRIPDAANAVVLDHKKGTPVKFTDDPGAPSLRIEEDPTLGGYTLLYRDLIAELGKKSGSFKANAAFHRLMEKLKQNSKYYRSRLLYPENPNSVKAHFYHPRIVKEILKSYP